MNIPQTLEEIFDYSYSLSDIGNYCRDINKKLQLEELQELQQLIKDELKDKNNIYGFPINLSFSTVQKIWQQIKLTNVHLIGGDNCELNLSIYVDPLPSGVNSGWIFLAILQNN